LTMRKSKPGQDLLWRLEAVFYDLFCGAMRLLPIDLASDLGAGFFRLVGPLTGAHKTARINLELAFPEASEREIRRLLGAQWENNGRLAAEFPLLDKVTPASGRIEVIGRERFVEIGANKEPVVFVSGHLSNFEVMASAIMDGGVTCLVTYRATNNPYIDRRIREGRQAYGVRLFAPKGESARELIEALKAGETIAIMNDQKFNTGVLVNFFGHPAHTAPGPTRLALGANAALQPMSVQRTRGARFKVTVHEPIPLQRSGDRAANIADGVAKVTAFIEARIRERPEEWFWVHRRWPNEVYAAHEARKARSSGLRRRRFLPIWLARKWLWWSAATLAVLAMAISAFWADDIRSYSLDPKKPFQITEPPPAPDYGLASAWALIPATPGQVQPRDPPVDVFFVAPTTFDGGRGWNGPIDDGRSVRLLNRVMLPNYAGPFRTVGRLFAPLYRQASLYAMIRVVREDARDARGLAYGDVRDAFRAYLRTNNLGRPFILAGVEQGGSILDRLLTEEISADPSVKARLVGAYLIETVVPADQHAVGAAIPACQARGQTGCVLAWKSSRNPIDLAGGLRSFLVWGPGGSFSQLEGRQALCVNPLLGAANEASAPSALSQGATNASGLGMSADPPLKRRAVSARCVKGLLQVSAGLGGGLKASGGWADRLKAPPYNLFYGDIEADAKARASAKLGLDHFPQLAPPITDVETVRVVPRLGR
ncbi:MAG: lipid biosynthesis acyltransferase, partial [Caulobacteraceae bacterium]|nr:lipid biosynthesis acyltransferase [Caulobacteraceae bacterium]